MEKDTETTPRKPFDPEEKTDMADVYLLGGCRTPIGKLLGSLSSLSATSLGAIVVGEALSRTLVDPGEVDEVIMGNVLGAGLGQAPARQAALGAGLPPTVAALTINKVCGSGLKAVMLADQAIRCGDAKCIVAGGMESMSRAPHLISRVRQGWKFGHQQVADSMILDGLWCAVEDVAMGAEADFIAQSRGVSREDQDSFAVESHRRAGEAMQSGTLEKEIVAVAVPGRKGDTLVECDEGPRPDTTVESLGKLRAAFDKDGTVTAGNASQISDGAAAVVVASEAVAQKSSAPLKFRIVASATSGVPPKEIFIAPVTAVGQVLKKAGMTLADIDLVELNEAFAAQCVACMRPLECDPAKTNIRGGAIAMGHPLGASGARILVTLMHALAAGGMNRGLASLCLGGGNAVAMIIERA